MSLEETLVRVPLFSEVGKRDCRRLAKLMVPRTFKAGDTIIKEGDQAAGFFIINSGKVEVVKGTTALATLGPGDFFGEMALFENYPRSATVRAVEDSECLAMTRWDFTAELHKTPEIAVNVIRVLVHRLRETNARLSE